MSIKMFIKGKMNALIKHSKWYNEIVFKGCTKFWKHSDFNLDVINLGSGASFHAFDYSGLPIKAANFALPSQFLLADYEILKNYFSYLKPGATVILGTSLFSLDGLDVTYFDDRYYSFLYPSSIWHFSIQKLKHVEDIRKNPIKYFPLWMLFSELKGIFHRKERGGMSEELMRKDAQKWMLDCWAKEFSIDDFNLPLSIRNRDLANQAKDIVEKIHLFCNVMGLRLVLVLPPVSPYLRELLTPSIRDKYVYVFRNSKKLKDLDYLDYLDDMDFNDSSLYKNAYFMSKKGAQKFTSKLLQDLNLIK